MADSYQVVGSNQEFVYENKNLMLFNGSRQEFINIDMLLR